VLFEFVVVALIVVLLMTVEGGVSVLFVVPVVFVVGVAAVFVRGSTKKKNRKPRMMITIIAITHPAAPPLFEPLGLLMMSAIRNRLLINEAIL